jgi:predicted nucleic acid-binding protein
VKLLVDINVVLDVVLDRAPWADDSALLLSALESGRATGFVAGHTVTTVHYVVAKAAGRARAATAITDLLRLVDVVPVEKADLHYALVLGWRDFEDAVQAACAVKIGADHLVTRNEADFAGLPMAALSPRAVLALL